MKKRRGRPPREDKGNAERKDAGDGSHRTRFSQHELNLMIKALGNLPTRDPHKITYTESEVLQKLIESGKVHYQLSEGWTFKALAEQMEKDFKLQVTERSLQKRYYQWCHDKGIQRAAVPHDEDAAMTGQD